jgi:hypothetical protein
MEFKVHTLHCVMLIYPRLQDEGLLVTFCFLNPKFFRCQTS